MNNNASSASASSNAPLGSPPSSPLDSPTDSPARTLRQLSFILLPFMLGYWLSYLFRSINAVLGPYLQQQTSLSASELGWLGGAYFLAFALFQPPLGALLDRYGPRRVHGGLMLLAALGALIFAHSNSIGGLVIGRILIGIGFAGGLMAAFKAITLWFPAKHWAMLNSIMIAVGGLGAATASYPVELWLKNFDAYSLFTALAGITVAVALAVFCNTPEHQHNRADHVGFRKTLRIVTADRAFRRLVPLATLSIGGNMALQTLWVGPWLRDVPGWSSEQTAIALLALALAMAISLLMVGFFSRIWLRFGISLSGQVVIASTLFQLSQLLIVANALPQMGLNWPLLPWLLMVIFGAGNSLAYTWVAQHFDHQISGKVTTLFNLLVFSCSFALQSGIGLLLDYFNPPLGAPSTSADYQQGYQITFLIALLPQLAMLVWCLMDRSAAGLRTSSR